MKAVFIIRVFNLLFILQLLFQDLDPVDYCDTDSDGFTSIELATFDAYVSIGIASTTVSYFLTEEDATDNENALSPYHTNTSNPEILYVRVRNSDTSCIDIAPLEINIIPAPTVSQPDNIVVCDDDEDAFSIVNLDSKIDEMVTSTTDLAITFHTSEDDANSNSNAISSPSAYNANTQTIYTRIEVISQRVLL